MDSPALVVFFGGAGETPVEAMVDRARLAASLDAIDAALSSEAIGRAILVTDDPALEIDVPGVEVDCSTGVYQFGGRLAEVIRSNALGSLVYMGGGSVPLFSAEDFDDVVSRLEAGVAVTNNHYSSDLIAFPVTDTELAAVEAVERDNALARALTEAGLTVESLPRTVVTQMDIDSPSDLLVLSVTGGCGLRLQAYLDGLGLDTSRYQRTLPLFTDRRAQVLVAGRVGSHAWVYLERETACRVRLFAEERGMEADGRAESARSLLGYYLESAGTERFFETLAELGEAAFLDTRVLLAHKRIAASREDRFLSDLGDWQGISDPFLLEFTRAACEVAVPVLLGGHSLMSGGLMALNEHAWALSER
ncbi:MAG: hypothetical protein WD904_08150 [Dehalococcoidia bacterium]